MSLLIGEAVSRVRNILKLVNEDSFTTDRFLYSLITKYGKTLMKAEGDAKNLYKNAALFKELPCVELIEVDRIEACCTDIKTGCSFMRSKDPLPKLMEDDDGPMIRDVTTLDYSKDVNSILPAGYMNMTKSTSFKYNKNKYYWIINNYLFIPDVTWEAVRLQVLPDGDISDYLCSGGNDKNICIVEQEKESSIPEYMFSQIENMIKQDLLTTVQLPSDGADDSKNAMR